MELLTAAAGVSGFGLGATVLPKLVKGAGMERRERLRYQFWVTLALVGASSGLALLRPEQIAAVVGLWGTVAGYWFSRPQEEQK